MMDENEGVARDIRLGLEYPYDEKDGADRDWAEVAALGILSDFSDRRGLKHELREIDLDIRQEIVATMAAIIRAAHKASPPRPPLAGRVG